MTTNEPARVPDECTLPTAEQPLRLAEFDELFATTLRRAESVTPTHARLRLTGPDGLATAVRSLAARETECCAFFEFRVETEATDEGEALTLDVRVPPERADVLGALLTRATAATSEPRRGRPETAR